MLAKYKGFVEVGKQVCAIFANLYCIKDRERVIPDYSRISPSQSAFNRYKEGFDSVVDLHYDFGYKYNVLVPRKDKISSAYCEVENGTKCNGGSASVHDAWPIESPTKTYYYCPNINGEFRNSCKGRERNLKINEYRLLKRWLNEGSLSSSYEDELKGLCGLEDAAWSDLFK